MMRPLIYISGPLTNGLTAGVRDMETNIANAQSVAVDLMAAGFAVFCPHSSGMWQREREIPYDEWLAHDFAIIDRCDAVYRLPGVSRGADAEVQYASDVGVPVFYAGGQTYEKLMEQVRGCIIEREHRRALRTEKPHEPPRDACGGNDAASGTRDGIFVSGTVTYSSGAVRSSDREAYRYDLIAPEGLRRLAMTCAEGAAKYGDHNWEKGMPAKVFVNHAMAHMASWLDGDSSEDHLAHAAWNLIAIMHFEKHGPQWIDCGPNVKRAVELAEAAVA